jgi:hypothetical protein
MRFATIRAVADALDARIDVTVRWHGGDPDRLLNARHAAMQEGIARLFAAVEGWIAEPEVSFSVYGERGVVDVLGWNADARVVLVIELKTEFVDVNELMGTLDRKRRLARNLARDRDWDARAVASWVIVADNRTNRRPSDARLAAAARRTPGRHEFHALGPPPCPSPRSRADPPREPASLNRESALWPAFSAQLST